MGRNISKKLENEGMPPQNPPSISVIIPCYNVADYLAECLESVLSQTYKILEIIIVDNASTDKTYEIAATYQKEHPDLIRLLREPRRGASAARNRGLQEAHGEWWQFLDADDLLLPEKIASQVALIQPDTNMVAGAYRLRGYTSGELIRRPDRSIPAVISAIRGNLGNTVANLFKRQAIFWDEELVTGEDLKFYAHYAVQDRVVYDTAPLTVNRSRPSGQLTGRTDYPALLSSFRARQQIVRMIERERPELAKEYESQLRMRLWYGIYRIARYFPNEAIQLFQETFSDENLRLTESRPDKVKSWHVWGTRILGHRLFLKVAPWIRKWQRGGRDAYN